MVACRECVHVLPKAVVQVCMAASGGFQVISHALTSILGPGPSTDAVVLPCDSHGLLCGGRHTGL